MVTPTQSQEPASEPQVAVNQDKKATGTEKEKEAEGGKKGKREKKEKTANNQRGASSSERTVVDVSRLDFRVGKIITAKRHPEADTLYIEESKGPLVISVALTIMYPTLVRCFNQECNSFFLVLRLIAGVSKSCQSGILRFLI